jgi:hypothetical protein
VLWDCFTIFTITSGLYNFKYTSLFYIHICIQ